MIRRFLLFSCIGCAGLLLCLFFWPRPPLLEDLAFGKVALDRQGNVLKAGLSSDDKYRYKINLDEIPSPVIEALLRYEDQYFYYHPGVNFLAVLRALVDMGRTGRKMGASTITMQVARLKYKIASGSITGKLRQMWQAFVLERHYSKAQLLEAYFNLAPYGGNIEGIAAAARIYFDKPVSKLTRMEIDALTVVPQNPVKRNPLGGSEFSAARKKLALLRGDQDAELPPLALRSVRDIKTVAPHLVMEQLRINKDDIIRLAIDRALQKRLEEIVKNYTMRNRLLGIENAACMLVDSDTMEVLASVGSANFHSDTISGQVDGTLARRSPGSTLKPFIYALALDQGLIHPASILPDSPKSYGGYDPENFDYGFRGPVTAQAALQSSRNLPAITLAEKLRYPDLYEFLKQAQVALPKSADYYGLALVLGGAETSMRELAALYCVLLNKGYWQPLRLTSAEPRAGGKKLLSPEAAWLTLKMLTREDAVLHNGSGQVFVRYKTGTSNGFRDAWTCGVFGKYALVVWVGNFDNSSNPCFIGAKAALPLFMELAGSVTATRQVKEGFSEAGLNLNQVEVCASTGDLARGQCAEVMETTIIPGISPIKDSGIIRPVLIDRATGLRACEEDEGSNDVVWMEFWPTDLRALFEKAGRYKPQPPEWLPQCRESAPTQAAKPPRMLLPKKRATYYRSLGQPEFSLPLQAAAEPGIKLLRWYFGRTWIGSTAPGETLFWTPPVNGKIELTVVDDKGGTSRQNCLVEIIP